MGWKAPPNHDPSSAVFIHTADRCQLQRSQREFKQIFYWMVWDRKCLRYKREFPELAAMVFGEVVSVESGGGLAMNNF